MKGGVPSIVLSEILHMFLQSGKNICSGFFWRVAYHLRAGALLWALLLSCPWGIPSAVNPCARDNLLRRGDALVLGRQPQGRGAHCHAYPPSPSGFSPPVPHFPSSPSPLGDGHALHVSTMLRRTEMNQSCAGNPENTHKRTFPQREGRVWKRERERKPLGGERISSLLRSLPS